MYTVRLHIFLLQIIYVKQIYLIFYVLIEKRFLSYIAMNSGYRFIQVNCQFKLLYSSRNMPFMSFGNVIYSYQ